MRIDVLTLFPDMFTGPLTESILKRAQEQQFLTVRLHDIRGHAEGKHRQVDDMPYGGGAGMVMMCEPIVNAIEAVTEQWGGDERLAMSDEQMKKARSPQPTAHNSLHRIHLTPRGQTLTQEKVEALSQHNNLLLLCGHYEGIDQRVIDGGWIDEEISIGDYVLTGGELPAMVLIDAVARQIPGVLGKEESGQEESFSARLDRKREYPHYTRPEEFRGMKVPDVLLSGHHAEIEKWRKKHLL